MAADVVGTAYVRIRAITTQIASDIQDGLNKAGFDKIGTDAGDKLGTSLGTSTKDNFSATLAKNGLWIPDGVGRKSGIKFSEEFSDSVKKTIPKSVPEDIIPESTSRGWGSRAAQWLHDAFRKSNDKETKKTTSSFEKSLSSVYKAFTKLKIPLPIWAGYFGAPIIAGLAKTATFYIGGLVARTGTLVEALIGGGVAFGALALQGVGALGLIFAAFKTETPQLIRFKERITEIGQEWKEVGKATQGPLLDGLDDAFLKLTQNLVPIFKDLGEEVGRIAGDTADIVTNLLTSERGMRMWEVFRDTTEETTGYLGQIVQNLARGFIPLLEAAAPLGTKLAASINHIASRWADFMERSSDSGRLQITLDKMYASAEKVASVLGDVFVGLYNILKIGSDVSGFAALDRLDTWAANWRAFTTSVEGENKIRKFFEEAEPVVREVNGIMKDIWDRFSVGVTEGSGSDTIVSVLREIRYRLLPAIFDGIEQITGSFNGADGNNAVKFVETFSRLIEVLVKAEILIPTMEIIIVLLNALVTVLNIPIVGDIAGPLLGIAAALRILHVPLALITAPFRLAAWAFGLFTTATLGLTGGATIIVGLQAVLAGFLSTLTGGGGTAVVGGFAGALFTLGTAIPIVAALAAVVTAAYFAFEPVREMIDRIWRNFQGLLDALRSGDWGEALKRIGRLFLDTLTFIPQLVIRILIGLGQYIIQFFQNLPGWIATGASALWSWLQEAIPKAAEAAANFVSQIPGWLAGIASTVISAVAGAASALWGWIAEAVPQIPYQIGLLIGTTIRALVTLPGRIIEAVSGAASALWSWLTGGDGEGGGGGPSIAERIGSWASSVFSALIEFVVGLPGTLAGAASALVAWIGDAIVQAPSRLAEFGRAVLDWIIGLPGLIIDGLSSAGSWLLETGKTIISGFLSGLSDGLGDLPSTVSDAISGAASSLWSWIQDAVPLAVEKIGEFIAAIPGALLSLGSTLGQALLSAGESLLGWIGEAASELPRRIGYFIGFLLGSIVRLPIDVGRALVSAAQSLWGWIVDAVPQMLTAIGGFFTSILGAVTTFVGNLPGWIVGAVSGLIGWISVAVPQALSAIGGFFLDIFNAVVGFVANLPGWIAGAIGGFIDWISVAAPQGLEAVGGFFTEIFNAVITFVGNLPGWISGAVEGIIGWLGEAITQLPGKLAEFADNIRVWATGLLGNILTWIGDIAGEMADIGQSIVEGIWDGILGAGDWLGDKIKEFAGGIWDGFADAIGFGSPARRFLPLGQSISQGVALGISQNTDLVDAAMKSLLSDGLVNPLSPNGPFGKIALDLSASQPFASMNAARVGPLAASPNVVQPLMGDVYITEAESPRQTAKAIINEARGVQYRGSP